MSIEKPRKIVPSPHEELIEVSPKTPEEIEAARKKLKELIDTIEK